MLLCESVKAHISLICCCSFKKKNTIDIDICSWWIILIPKDKKYIQHWLNSIFILLLLKNIPYSFQIWCHNVTLMITKMFIQSVFRLLIITSSNPCVEKNIYPNSILLRNLTRYFRNIITSLMMVYCITIVSIIVVESIFISNFV